MTKVEYYDCDVCRRRIDHDKQFPPDGWPLTWHGPGVDRPKLGSTLEPTRPWSDSPVHLCQICVQAIGKFYESARRANQLQDKPEACDS